MNSPVLRRIASGFIAVLLLIYIGYQVYNSNYSRIKTETAAYATAQDTISAKGAAVRKEALIRQEKSGVLTYALSSGGKIAKGGVVADLYDSAAAATAQQQADSLSAEVAQLQKLSSPGDTYAANPDLLKKQIDQKLTLLLTAVQEQDYSGVPEARSNLLYLLNERQIVTGKSKDYSSRIAELQKQLQSASPSGGGKTGQIKSPAAGYFINSADGYEEKWDYASVPGLSASQLREKLSQKPAAVPSGVVGKVCEEFGWYFACVVPPDEALKFKEGQRVSIRLPFAVSEDVPATVAAVNQKDRQSEAALVLQSSYMDQEIASIRNETVQIQAGSYSGIMVSKEAVHFEKLSKKVTGKDGKTTTVTKQVQGVYVLHGRQIEFVQIVPLFNSGSYVICQEIGDTDEAKDQLMTKSSIRLYDEVVIEGTDLYDGKIVK